MNGKAKKKKSCSDYWLSSNVLSLRKAWEVMIITTANLRRQDIETPRDSPPGVAGRITWTELASGDA